MFICYASNTVKTTFVKVLVVYDEPYRHLTESDVSHYLI